MKKFLKVLRGYEKQDYAPYITSLTAELEFTDTSGLLARKKPLVVRKFPQRVGILRESLYQQQRPRRPSHAGLGAPQDPAQGYLH